jgi:hypothetical protein
MNLLRIVAGTHGWDHVVIDTGTSLYGLLLVQEQQLGWNFVPLLHTILSTRQDIRTSLISD